ncbi:MAG: TetR/AcrR family transcriptional regulator [Deferrisomatales bacterium]
MTRKVAILQAAKELFAEKGFDGTSTAEIAERAGVAHGTVFHHFKTKENLLLEMGEALFEAYLEGFRQLPIAGVTGWQGLEASIRYHFTFMAEHARGILVMVRESPRVLGQSFCGPHADPIRRGMAELNDLRRRLVERGQADGSIRPCAVDDTVFLVDSLLGGIVHNQAKGFVEMPAEVVEATVAFCRRSLCAEG